MSCAAGFELSSGIRATQGLLTEYISIRTQGLQVPRQEYPSAASCLTVSCRTLSSSPFAAGSVTGDGDDDMAIEEPAMAATSSASSLEEILRRELPVHRQKCGSRLL